MMISRVILSIGIILLACSKEQGTHIIFPDSLLIDTIPFSSTPDSNIILLDVIVDTKPYQFIFDTASETTLINSNMPSTKVSPDTIFFRDIFYESHSAHEVMVDTLTLSKIKVIQKDSYHQRTINLDGIIGRSEERRVGKEDRPAVRQVLTIKKTTQASLGSRGK